MCLGETSLVFVFPMKVTENWPICLFINYAYIHCICTGIRRNLNKMCLFSSLEYYHMT